MLTVWWMCRFTQSKVQGANTGIFSTCLLQVEEAKRQREGKPWSDEEQAAFKAQIADRCEDCRASKCGAPSQHFCQTASSPSPA